TKLLGRARMDLQPRLGRLAIEEAEAAGLVAAEIVVNDAPRRQPEGIGIARLFCRWLIGNREHLCAAVGVPELLGKQARRAGMIELRAGPEDALLILDLLPGDAVVVRHTAARRFAQLVPDCPRATG